MANQIHHHLPDADGGRRDFLLIATGAVATFGAAAALWPIIDSLNPAADVLGISSSEIDLGPIEIGQRVTITWRGKPVFIDHRTPEQMNRAIADDVVDLPDFELDSDRVQNPEWLIVIGICTHLGCIPLGQRISEQKGDFGGWFCPCHGSHYDTSGRVRKGPAQKNLVVPNYQFLDDGRVRVG